MKLPLLWSLTLAACLAAPVVAHADGDQSPTKPQLKEQLEQRLHEEKQLLQELSSEPDQTGGPSTSGHGANSPAPHAAQSQSPSMDSSAQNGFVYYKGPGHKLINGLLRGTATASEDDVGNLVVGGMFTDHPLAKFQRMIRAMGNYMFYAKKYTGKEVYRGLQMTNETDIERFKKELLEHRSSWEDGGFFSTAAAASPAVWQGESQFAKGNIAMVVDLPANGKHGGVAIDANPEIKHVMGGHLEKEVLFPPTQRFKVVEIVDDPKKVKKELGLGNAAKVPKMLVRLEALPYTQDDMDRLNEEVDALAQKVSRQGSTSARWQAPALGRKADIRNSEGTSPREDVVPPEGRMVDPLDGRNESVNPLDGKEVVPQTGTTPGRKPWGVQEEGAGKRPSHSPDHEMHGE